MLVLEMHQRVHINNGTVVPFCIANLITNHYPIPNPNANIKPYTVIITKFLVVFWQISLYICAVVCFI